MKITNRIAVLAAALVFFFGATGCEISDPLEDVELIVDVEDAEVDLGSGGVAVAVQSGETAATTTTVASELDVEEVKLETINLKPSFFTFIESGQLGKVMDTGTLSLLVSFGLPGMTQHPLPPVTITIEDNVVTNVQPASIDMLGTTYDIPAIQAMVEDLPAGQRPNLASLADLTIDETREAIEAALSNSTGFDFSIVLQSNGVSGSLQLNQLSFGGQVSQGTN